jgi:hypothetical protein
MIASNTYQKAFVRPPTYEPSFGSRLVRGLQAPGTVPGMESLSERRKELLRQLLEQGAAQ